MFIEEGELDEIIVNADELYKNIDAKKNASVAIKNVDNDFFLLCVYSHELIKQTRALAAQSKGLANMTAVLAILALGTLFILVVSIFAQFR